jgi:hypothetical protein
MVAPRLKSSGGDDAKEFFAAPQQLSFYLPGAIN